MTCPKCCIHYCYRCGIEVDAKEPYKHFASPGAMTAIFLSLLTVISILSDLSLISTVIDGTVKNPCYKMLFDTDENGNLMDEMMNRFG